MNPGKKSKEEEEEASEQVARQVRRLTEELEIAKMEYEQA